MNKNILPDVFPSDNDNQTNKQTERKFVKHICKCDQVL